MDFLELNDCFRSRSGDLAQVLSWPRGRLYHGAEHYIDRLSYLDQGDTTESTTHSLSCEVFPCHEGVVPTGREISRVASLRVNNITARGFALSADWLCA